ncbi:uncharacterized protein V6R79_024007 [Siganus canaliculatus]
MQKGLKKYFVNMDEYLCSLGLYRKMVARDASSLFRAVSEQLYYSQNYHQSIRQDCANFMRANRCDFEPFVEGSFEKYLERLEDPKETVGHVEIKALSQLYRRCFLIYRYPGKPATVISEDNFVEKVTLCCSINGHYDIAYPRSYPASAALCQSLLYELLYIQVFGLEETQLCHAMEGFRVGGRRYRNSTSICSDIDIGYDTCEDRVTREELESGGTTEDKFRAVAEETKPHAEALPTARLSLPYKVMKSLDGEIYRNLEFDVWQDTCKEMQKTDYMVFAGRQYFLGDKCQVRLEPKGKYYNAFIQEVGTHSSAVTVFIEELGEKHLVPLTDLKPVNPVPAWNIATPTRKGDLDLDSRGQRQHHRHRYFRKSRGNSGVKGAELIITSQSSTRFLNRHLIGPQLTYYHPGRRYCHDFENYAFRSRRSRRQLATLNKECQFGFSAEAVEEPTDLDPTIAYYQMDNSSDSVFPPLAGQTVPPAPTMAPPPPPPNSTYRVQRGSGPIPPGRPPGNTPICSSEEDQEETSTVEDQAEYTDEYIYMSQDQGYPASSVYTTTEASTTQEEQEGGAADSPPRPEMNYSYTQQVVKPLSVICSSPSSSSSSTSSPSSLIPAATHLPPPSHTQTRSVAMTIPAAPPWLVNELGEAICTMVAPPPYSYDPNGSDLPRDCRVLQYYFNLGVQWYYQSCWQQQQAYSATSPEAPYPYQHYTPYLSQEPPLHAVPPSYPDSSRGPHQPTSSYTDSTRAGDGPVDGHSTGPASSMEGSSTISPTPAGSTPSSVLLFPDQIAPPPILHLPYESPPPTTYLSSAPPPHPLPHSAHPQPPHQSAFHPCLPPPFHWGAAQSGGHGSRVYCPAPNPGHVLGYITASSHHTPAHYIPPTI